MQLAHNTRKTSGRKFQRICIAKNLRITKLNATKNFLNTILYRKLTIRIFTLKRSRVKIQFARKVFLILNLAKNNFEELKECLVLVKSVISVNIIVASPKHKKQIIIDGVFQVATRWTVNFGYIPFSRGNIIVFLKKTLASRFILNLMEDKTLNAICPHAPLAIYANTHIGFELFNSVLRSRRINLSLLALNDDFNCRLLSPRIFAKNNYIGTRSSGTILQSKFNSNLTNGVFVLLNEPTLYRLANVFFLSVVAKFPVDVVKNFSVWNRSNSVHVPQPLSMNFS